MAFAITQVVNTVFGDKRIWTGRITPDAATGVATIPGAVAIDGIISFSQTGGTSLTCAVVAANVNASGVAANGVLGFSNVASTQIFTVSVAYH